MKYYAVKNGREVGIFETWDACKVQVDGFKGAKYKSFKSLKEAQNYLNDEEVNTVNECVAYVDGSFDLKTWRYSYGAVILYQGKQHEFYEAFNDVAYAKMRNVAGELRGAMKAMDFCIENGIDELDLYYDYEGIEKWCKRIWKTNKDETKAYVAYYDEVSEKVLINFHKVKAHSNDKYNDLADALAKKALGL